MRDPIALVGIGCRFPSGADDPNLFWQMLCDGRDGVSGLPSDRLNAEAFYHADLKTPGKMVSRWGGFVSQPVELFDARFFGMSPREAAQLDPMQRWLMEVTWEAFEDAGIPVSELAGSRTGVFVGIFTEDNKLLQLDSSNRHLIGPHTATGISMTMASNRLSYWFDLRGVSVSIDTACSSSLVAVHLACQSLWRDECSLAIAGGANAMFKPEFTIAESRAGMLSPDGRCRAFDARANGYVRGEGAGVVVLKRLSRALADRDRVYALVVGTASNQDGRTPSITVPNGDAQQDVVLDAFEQAGVSPGQLRYMEAHGTGTPVGDPIEATALGRVLAQGRRPGDKCWLGSVKANIGHLEAAAGVAGLIKAALCLQRRAIPPQIQFETPNPKIPFDELCLRIPRRLETWPEEPGPALAAVNSFGFGGSNAHVVLAAAESTVMRPETGERAELVTLSAKSEQALADVARTYKRHLEGDEGRRQPLQAIAYTTTARRSHHGHRLAFVAKSTPDLLAGIDRFLGEPQGRGAASALADRAPKVAWVFSGMGPQWWAMGRELLASEPVFRAKVVEIGDLLARHASWRLVEELGRDESSSRMAETQISQPANFALQVGIAALLESWGHSPSAVVGHSTGEAAAAHVSGAMSLEEATRLIYHRSFLQHRTTGQGSLLAVGLPVREAEALLQGVRGVSIAAVNSPGSTTLSGDSRALQSMARELDGRGVFNRLLQVTVPFHSPMMDPLRDDVFAALSDLSLRDTEVPLFSTVTARAIDGPSLDAGYWWRNIRDPVQFAATIDSLLEDGCNVFLEVGPHPVVTSAMKECFQARGSAAVAVPTLRRGAERAGLLEAVGQMYTLGIDAAWNALFHEPITPVSLPTYPWQRERHWSESLRSREDRFGRTVHPLLGRRLVSAEPTWQQDMTTGDGSGFADHRIQGAVVIPGAAYVDMAVAALHDLAPDTRGAAIEELELEKAGFLDDEDATRLQTTIDGETRAFRIFSRRGEQSAEWTRHARGRLAPVRSAPVERADVATLQGSARELDVGGCYQQLAALGYEYGPRFRTLRRLWREGREAVAWVEADARDEAERHCLQPAVLDGCFQALLAAALPEMESLHWPVRIARLRSFRSRLPSSLWVRAELHDGANGRLNGDLTAWAADGSPVLSIEGMEARSLDAGKGALAQPLADLFYSLDWQPKENGEAPPPQVDTAGSYVVFADRRGLGASIADGLRRRGASALLVTEADRFAEAEGGRAVSIDPARPEHYDRLCRSLIGGEQAGGRLTAVHLWNLDAPDPRSLSAEVLLGAQGTACLSLVHWVQALGRLARPQPSKLWVVTRGAQAAAGSESVSQPAQATAWGLARTLFHQEHGELAGGIIDLDPRDSSQDVETVLGICEQHIPSEDQIAVRQGKLLVPRLAAARDLALGSLLPRIRRNRSYVVTGGLGALGQCVSRWLVGHGAGHLLLMGRTALPDRGRWTEVDTASRQGQLIAAIRDLEASGTVVHVAAVDVADEQAARRALDAHHRDGLPPVGGVIHAAGVAPADLIMRIQPRTYLETVRAKVAGSWNLHSATVDEPLDFFVLFSSVSGLGFSAGMGAYAAGNAFLDGLAHWRRSLGLPATSIAWGAWADVGMASSPELARSFEQRGFSLLDPELGLRAMERVLERDVADPVVLARVDWPQARRANYPLRAPRMLDRLSEPTAGGGASGSTATANEPALVAARLRAISDPAERRAALEAIVLGLAAKVFRCDPAKLGLDEPLVGLGLDSMLALELRAQIDSRVGATCSVVELLQGATVASVAGVLATRMRPGDGVAADAGGLVADLEAMSPQEAEELLTHIEGRQ